MATAASIQAYYIDCNVGALSNYSNFQNNTNFTLDQFDQYVRTYSYYVCLVIPAMQRTGFISFAISGVVGFVAFLFMFATLKHVSINSCTLIYHKGTVVLEVVHMVIMAQHGITQIYKSQIPNSWVYLIWLSQMGNGWAIGDSIKLAVSFLTTFLMMERFIAVRFAFVFKKFNTAFVAYTATVISLCIGSAHVWIIGLFDIVFDPKMGKYVASPTPFATSSFYNFILNFIYTAKVGLSVIIFILCLATAIQLKIIAKKAASLNNKAKEEWVSKKKACTFAYLLGISILFDHVIWVSYKIYKQVITDNSGEKAVRFLTYNEALVDIEQRKVAAILELGQRVLGQIVHSWRFFLYLAFNKTMRDGFIKIFSKRAVAGAISITRKTGVRQISKIVVSSRATAELSRETNGHRFTGVS